MAQRDAATETGTQFSRVSLSNHSLGAFSTNQDVPQLAHDILPESIASATWVGSGGCGDVYQLDHQTLGPLALKRIKESGPKRAIAEQRRRALREGNIWFNLDHPNILKLIGVVDSEPWFYFVCPFQQNGSLMDYLKDHPHSGIDRKTIISECIDALAYLHDKGILHGDIKAANVLLSDDMHPLICDFGLSRTIDNTTSTTLMGKGSIRWMSPELLEQGKGKSFASDVWATGMMMYEIMSGYLPYKDLTSQGLILTAILVHRILPPTEPTHSVDGVSYESLWALVSTCWKRDANERPSMADLCTTLRSHIVPSSALTGSSPSTPKQPPRTLSHENFDATHRLTSSLLGTHSGAVFCVAFSHDSRVLASASEDRTIRLWNIVERNQIGEPLKGHSSWVRTVAFSPEGGTLVSGASDCSLRFWDVASADVTSGSLKGHSASVWSVVFSPDGRTFASGCWDRTIRIWDAASKECVAVLRGHASDVNCVSYSPNGKWLVSCSDDCTIRVWDLETYTAKGPPLRGHIDWVLGVAISPDGCTIASCCSKGDIRLWDAGTGLLKHAYPLDAHGDSVLCVAFSPDGRVLATGSMDTTIGLCGLAGQDYRAIGKLKGHADSVQSVAFSADAKWLVSGSSDRSVRVWDMSSLLGTRGKQ